MKMMLAARMHQIGGSLSIDTIPVPEPRPSDVLIEVKACGMVPNLENVLKHWTTWFPYMPLPKLPAIFGLDPAGVVVQTGSQVGAIKPGDRVYVNPGRGCGSCRMCRSGQIVDCPSFTYQGYFGRSPAIHDAYPYGGFSQFITAPVSALVKLPSNVSFEAAARFGYLGTAYAAMKKIGAGPSTTLLINGISGTLGLGAALLGLAMGVPKILGTGRDAGLLRRVKALAPARIEIFAVEPAQTGSDAKHAAQDAFGKAGDALGRWALEHTDGDGVDAVIDALPPGSPAAAMTSAFQTLRRGGRAADIGGMLEILPLNVNRMMGNNITLIGSCWFTTAEGQDMAAMAGAGTLDLSALEHRRFPLAKINEALSSLRDRNGGFTNVVIIP